MAAGWPAVMVAVMLRGVHLIRRWRRGRLWAVVVTDAARRHFVELAAVRRDSSFKDKALVLCFRASEFSQCCLLNKIASLTTTIMFLGGETKSRF